MERRRYIDLSGVPEWARGEILSLAQEVEQAQQVLAAERTRANASTRRAGIAAFLAAVFAGLLGYWRGRRRAQPRISVRPGAPKKGARQ